jgi:hypothetical protein
LVQPAFTSTLSTTLSDYMPVCTTAIPCIAPSISFIKSLTYDANQTIQQITLVGVVKGQSPNNINKVIYRTSVHAYVTRNFNDCKIYNPASANSYSINTNNYTAYLAYSSSSDTLTIDLIKQFNIYVSDENYFNLTFSISKIDITTNTMVTNTITSGFTTNYNVLISSTSPYMMIVGTYLPYPSTTISANSNYYLDIYVQVVSGSVDTCTFTKRFIISVYPSTSISPWPTPVISNKTWYYKISRLGDTYSTSASVTDLILNPILISDNLVTKNSNVNDKDYSFSSTSSVLSYTITDVSTKTTINLTIIPITGTTLPQQLKINISILNNSMPIDSNGLVTVNNSWYTEAIPITIYDRVWPRSYTFNIRVQYSPKNKVYISGPSGNSVAYNSAKSWSFDYSNAYVLFDPEDADISSKIDFSITTYGTSCTTMTIDKINKTLNMIAGANKTNCYYKFTITLYKNAIASVDSNYYFILVDATQTLPAPSSSGFSSNLISSQATSSLYCIAMSSYFSTTVSWASTTVTFKNNYVTPALTRPNSSDDKLCWDTTTLPLRTTYTPVYWDNPYMNFMYINRLNKLFLTLSRGGTDSSVISINSMTTIEKPLLHIRDYRSTYYVIRNDASPFLIQNLILNSITVYDTTWTKTGTVLLIDNANSTGSCSSASLTHVPANSITSATSAAWSGRYLFGNRILDEYQVSLTQCTGVVDANNLEKMSLQFYLQVSYTNGAQTATLTSVNQKVLFQVVDKPIFVNCSSDQTYMLNHTFYYGIRMLYNFNLSTSSTTPTQLSASYRGGYYIDISPNPNNFKLNDVTFGQIYYDAPSSAPANCASLTGTTCTLQDHTITVYSKVFPYLKSSCTVKVKLDNNVVFPPKTTSALSPTSFLCEIGTTFSFDFSVYSSPQGTETLLTDITYFFTSSATVGNFLTSELILNKSTGVLTWACRDLYSDLNNIFYPMETPDISIYALSNKNVPAYLLTFNIKPYRKPILNFSNSICRDANTGVSNYLISNKDYYCQFSIKKCTNNLCTTNSTNFVMKYNHNISLKFSPAPVDANFNYNFNLGAGYLKFRYNCSTCTGSVTLSLTAIVEEVLKFVNPNFTISSNSLNFSLTFNLMSIPKFTFYDNLTNLPNIQTYSDDSFNPVNTVSFTNIWAAFGGSVNIYFLASSLGTISPPSAYSYLMTNVASIARIEIKNKPADLFLIEETSKTKYKMVYTSKSYNDIDLQISVQQTSGPSALIFFRIKTYYEFNIVVSASLSTTQNKPYYISLIPAVQSSNTQEIRLSDYILTNTSQKICLTTNASTCNSVTLVTKYNPLTGVFYFYADRVLSAGNYCKYF